MTPERTVGRLHMTEMVQYAGSLGAAAIYRRRLITRICAAR